MHDFGSVLGTAFGHFLLGSHNFMVTALGSFVEVAFIMVKRARVLAWVGFRVLRDSELHSLCLD